jgi:hypothetical protein
VRNGRVVRNVVAAHSAEGGWNAKWGKAAVFIKGACYVLDVHRSLAQSPSSVPCLSPMIIITMAG